MDEIYQVERDEYAGFIGSLKVDCFDVETIYNKDETIINNSFRDNLPSIFIN